MRHLVPVPPLRSISRIARMKRLAALTLPVLLIAACGTPFEDDGPTGGAAGAKTIDSKIDRRLAAVLHKGAGATTPGVAQKGDLIDVLIAANPSALPKLNGLGIHVRTVTSSGVMTATVPLHKVNAIAALNEVFHIEVAKR